MPESRPGQSSDSCRASDSNPTVRSSAPGRATRCRPRGAGDSDSRTRAGDARGLPSIFRVPCGAKTRNVGSGAGFTARPGSDRVGRDAFVSRTCETRANRRVCIGNRCSSRTNCATPERPAFAAQRTGNDPSTGDTFKCCGARPEHVTAGQEISADQTPGTSTRTSICRWSVCGASRGNSQRTAQRPEHYPRACKGGCTCDCR